MLHDSSRKRRTSRIANNFHHRNSNIAITSGNKFFDLSKFPESSTRNMLRFLWLITQKKTDLESRNFDSTACCLDYDHRLRYGNGSASREIVVRWRFTLWSRKQWENPGNWSQIETNHGRRRIQSKTNGTLTHPRCCLRFRILKGQKIQLRKPNHDRMSQLKMIISMWRRLLESPSTKEDTVVKVLGLNWNTLSDELYFDFHCLHKYAISLPLTKRSILRVTAKIFDPMAGILNAAGLQWDWRFYSVPGWNFSRENEWDWVQQN